MGAVEAVEFLKKDHGDVGTGFRQEFAEDKPYRSLLQRNDKMLSEMLEMFDWHKDDAAWCEEYDKKKDQDMQKLIRLRRRVYFELSGWREMKEDFGRGDVSCLRDIRVPLVTSRSPLLAMKDEFNE